MEDEDVKTLGDYMDALRRRKLPLLAVAVSILVISGLVALFLPPVYRSTATILIEQQEIPQDLVRSTITTYADQRIQIISQRVMTTANLQSIVDRYDLYAEERENQPIEVVLEEMREDISMEPISAEVRDPRTGKPSEAVIAFTVSYENESPRLAQVVANDITSLFLNENVKSRTEQAEGTTTFLTAEEAKMEAELDRLETALAEFKEQNVHTLPELKELNFQLMDRTEREMSEVERQLDSLEERKVMLQAQLSSIKPYEYDYVIGPDGRRLKTFGPADQLEALRTEYLSKAGLYGQDHPDIVRLKKSMEALEKETGAQLGAPELFRRLEAKRVELAEARERYAPAHPDVKRLAREVEELEAQYAVAETRPEEPELDASSVQDNPNYVQLKSQFDAAVSEQNSLKERLTRLRAKQDDLEQRLVQTPQVEREYSNLMRKYETALAKYNETRAKVMEAEVSSALETSRRGERLTLIEPPLLPEEPVKPNRMAIFFLGVVFSFAGGIGSAAVLEAVDNTVRGMRGVAAVTMAPPLAVIPYIQTGADRRRRGLFRAGWVLAVVVLAAVGAAVIHFFIVPLDVAWFMALRKAGL